MTATKTELAYQAIKKKILEGDLPPLRDVSEESLQGELGLSRTPIREACQRLSKEGFIYIFPSKGMIVAEITSDLIREIYQMRLLNEPFIASQAARNPPQWLNEIRERLLHPPAGLNDGATRLYFINLDRELHDKLLSASKNRFLQASMAIVLDHNHRIRLKVSQPYEQHERSIQEHLDIIDAILKRDEMLSEDRIRAHIQHSRKMTVDFFS
ncbi:GntR family transcriptional regulator [Ensifer aridi]|uniref:GntR family transcriptional regulator n=1 Tax=Ensifer aridi TaxID=1708715 RepID=UPI000555AF52|nr:GntR family transcriptional regulator [Ensifer aridi]